jgi:hypothetical protein
MSTNYRLERIERLLSELEYEITRGMLDREIEEEMVFQFVIPVSRKIPDGVVLAQFRTRPISAYAAPTFEPGKPRLTIVK